MKSPSSPDRLLGIIEPLEARIAPADVYIGSTDFLNVLDTEYTETNPVPEQTIFFINTSDASSNPGEFEGSPSAPADDPISQAIDGFKPDFDPLVDDYSDWVGTYYMRLKAGDRVLRFTFGNNYQELLTVNAGHVIAFFVDYDHDNEYDDKEFTGLSLSRDANVLVSDKVYGDIVTNLDTKGTNAIGDDTLDMTGLVSPKQGIAALRVPGGSVFGNVFSGGDIKKLIIGGNVDGVYAGTAANGRGFDFFPDGPVDTIPVQVINGGQGTITFAAPSGRVGASIQKVHVVSVTDAIQAGDGGFGAAGGSLKMVEVTNDNDGMDLFAGNGGVANAAANQPKGGAGGVVSDIYVSGASDPTPNSPLISQHIDIKAGFGGDGLATTKGGAGGKAKTIFVGYDFNGTTAIPSGNLTADNVLIEAGAGGDGSKGGVGGAVKESKVRVATPDADGEEIVLRAGAGGDSLAPSGGIAGVGGLVQNVEVRNQILTFNSDILVAAGSGGTTVGDGKGVNGGSVVNAMLLGFDVQVLAGDGSDGKKGGIGGSINTLRLLEDDHIETHNALINAGKGGNGNNGPGGAGGTVEAVRTDSGDFQSFTINSGSQGDGGASIGSTGGTGGRVFGLDISDTDTGFQIQGPIIIRAGNGGDGDRGGGAGGKVKQALVEALNANIDAIAGNGGDAGIKGIGGKGGKTESIQFTSDGTVFGVNVHGLVRAGAGGDGVGKKGAGGKGGDASLVNVNVAGDATLIAGDGGNGAFNSVSGKDVIVGGAPGLGGNVGISGLFARIGAGEMRAGHAGAEGNAPAAGGSIFGGSQGELVGLRASLAITALGGNGTHGGAGGSISDLAYGSTAASLTPTPSGNILIQAGNGSSEGAKAGAGGSLKLIDGAISSGLNTETMLLGGDGGSIVSRALPVTEEIPGGPGTSEVQRLNITALAGIAKAVFTVSIGGVTSERISATTNLTDFQAKLDAAFGPGTVTAARVPDTKTLFTLTFATAADQPLITATGYTGSLAAKGGNISDISISLGGGAGVDFMVEAGDGGDALGNGKVGGKGGKVNALGLSDIDDLTIVRSIAAGDGGDARKTGGAGGGITFVSIQDHDIGVRAGLNFGYDAMGGLFVGAGGKASNGIAGLAGSASDINADSIASIVAGRTLVPELAEKVTRITLNDSNQLVVRDGALVKNTPFTLTFGGSTTDLLPGNATRAQVETALNQLPSITGGVTVAIGKNPNISVYDTYIVTFLATGDQVLLTGEEQVPVDVRTTVPGQILTFPTIETQPGTSLLPVLETTPGQRDLPIIETVSGESFFTASEQTRGDNIAVPPVQEVQRISLLNLAPFPTGVFNLTFGANTTGPLPSNATAAQISTALNNLASIQLAGGVVVTTAGNASFDIRFQTPGDVGSITGQLLIPETQRLFLGDLPTFPTGQMTLTFGPSTTAPIAATSTAAQIDAALETLASIVALPGTAGNKVAVSAAQAGVFNITFNSIGQKASLVATGLLPETQQVNLGVLPAFPTATFTLAYNTVTTPPIAMAPDGTGPVAADIDAALEALITIPGPAGNKVSVVKTSTNLFNVTFNSNGDKLSLVAIGETRELQTLDLNSIATTFGADFTLDVSHFVDVNTTIPGVTRVVPTRTIQEGQVDLSIVETMQGQAQVLEVQRLDLGVIGTATNGEFVLEFVGEQTPAFGTPPPNGVLTETSTAAEIDAALNALQSIIDAGGVIVAPAGPTGVFDITFSSPGDQALIVGTGILSEAQGVDLGSVLGLAGGEFTLSITDPVDPTIIYTTAPIPQGATPGTVENALNDLAFVTPPAVFGTLGVTVVAGTAGDEYRITFGSAGDRNLLMGAGGGTVDRETQTINLSPLLAFGTNQLFTLSFAGASTLPLKLTDGGATDATAIQDALNALTTVQAVRPPDPDPTTPPAAIPGAVAVVSTTPGVFDVTFNIFGGQPLISGVSRVGPDAQHIGLTIRLPYNATAAQIQAAIQAVSQATVSVAPGTAANTFDITFIENGDQPAINVTAYLHETQNVDVYAIGEFNLQFNSVVTGIRLAPPPDPVIDPVGAAAAAAAIDLELEKLSSVQALDPLDDPNTLVPNRDIVEVHIGPNSSFSVLFHSDGDVTLLGGTQFEAMYASNMINGQNRNGTVSTRELQEIAYPRKGEFEAIYFSQANLVGGISDINEIDSNVFHYLHLGELMSGTGFQPGDTPIDGLIMAKTFNQDSANFTPEAKLTLFGFFDSDNVI